MGLFTIAIIETENNGTTSRYVVCQHIEETRVECDLDRFRALGIVRVVLHDRLECLITCCTELGPVLGISAYAKYSSGIGAVHDVLQEPLRKQIWLANIAEKVDRVSEPGGEQLILGNAFWYKSAAGHTDREICVLDG